MLIRIIKTGKTSYFRPKLSWVLDHVFHIHNIHLLTHSFFFKFARFNNFLSSSPQHVILNELWRMAYGVLVHFSSDFFWVRLKIFSVGYCIEQFTNNKYDTKKKFIGVLHSHQKFLLLLGGWKINPPIETYGLLFMWVKLFFVTDFRGPSLP